MLGTICVCTCFTARAEAEYGIGVVNIEKVMNESSVGKASRSGLNEQASKLRSEVQEKRETLQSREKELKAKNIASSSPESKQFREQVKEFNRFVSDSEEDLRQKYAQSGNSLAAQIRSIIRQVAQEKGLSIVLDGSEHARSGVLFRQEQLDITPEVMERFH